MVFAFYLFDSKQFQLEFFLWSTYSMLMISAARSSAISLDACSLLLSVFWLFKCPFKKLLCPRGLVFYLSSLSKALITTQSSEGAHHALVSPRPNLPSHPLWHPHSLLIPPIMFLCFYSLLMRQERGVSGCVHWCGRARRVLNVCECVHWFCEPSACRRKHAM